MCRRPPRSTRTDTLFPTRRLSDLWSLRKITWHRRRSARLAVHRQRRQLRLAALRRSRKLDGRRGPWQLTWQLGDHDLLLGRLPDFLLARGRAVVDEDRRHHEQHDDAGEETQRLAVQPLLFIRAKERRVGVEIRCVLLLVAGKIGVHPIGRLSVGIARWLTLGVVLSGRRALAHCSVFLLRPTTCLPYRITRYR